MSETGGSDIKRLWNWIPRSTQNRLKIRSFKFTVVLYRIRLFPTLISKIKWLWSGLTLDKWNLECTNMSWLLAVIFLFMRFLDIYVLGQHIQSIFSNWCYLREGSTRSKFSRWRYHIWHRKIWVIFGVKPFESKNRDKIYIDAPNLNLKKVLTEIFERQPSL